MTRIVTTSYRYKRLPLRRAKSAATEILAIVRAGTKPKAAIWGLVAAGALLAGCAAIPAPPTNTSPSTATGITMPTTRTEAVASEPTGDLQCHHGVWLWPPAATHQMIVHRHHALPLQAPAGSGSRSRSRCRRSCGQKDRRLGG